MKNLMKKAVSLILAAAMAAAIAVPAGAYEPTIEDQAYPIAQALNEAGLFNGTGTREDGLPEFDLGGTATRAQAIVMLVRILGKEEEAKEVPDAPFTDVPDWARPHVNYAYAYGLTNGTSEETFGSNDSITNTQYLTFCLRALGYGDSDFQWDKAYTFAQELGLIEKGEYENSSDAFKRADVVLITYSVMNTPMKDSTQTLAEHQGITLREVSRGTLPSIVTAQIRYMDPNDPQYWRPNNLGTKTFSYSTRVPYGTILTPLENLKIEKGMTGDEVLNVLKEMEKLFNSFNDNLFSQITYWKSGAFSFNVGPPSNSAALLSGIIYYPETNTFKVSGKIGSNWAGNSLDRSRANITANTLLNSMYVVDHDMGQKVFAMFTDYYWNSTARPHWVFQDEPEEKQWVVFEGDCGPITPEFVQKYGLTYVSGRYEDPSLETYGDGEGISYVTVTNGEKTWEILYRMPNIWGETDLVIDPLN